MNDKALVRRLGNFIAFERAVRQAENKKSLDSVVCNEVASIISCATAVRIAPVRLRGFSRRSNLKVRSVSGVSFFEHDAPLVRLIENHVADLESVQGNDRSAIANTFTSSKLDSGQHASTETQTTNPLSTLGLDSVLALPLATDGWLLLLRNGKFREEECRIGDEIAAVVSHAEKAIEHKTKGYARANKDHSAVANRWSRRMAIAMSLTALAFIPIRQSVMADAEVVAARPLVVAASMDGIVRSLAVRPNERVTRGQLLVSLDDTDLVHQRARLSAEIALLKEQQREAAQSTLERSSRGARMAELNAEIDLKNLDLDFVDERIEALSIRAEANGIAVYSREADWLGRAVRTGDNIMEIAVDAHREFEAWVAVNDAIRLDKGAKVKFFPDAFPLDATKGSVDNVSFFATSDSNDQLAYRVVASMADDDNLRLGMKGVVRLYGERVALGYALFRKPAAAARRAIGL